ncbi:response regulator [Paenibacillus sp. J5C_2022]|uniref:response regulator n=1 Tax=Paenibacillus sp. J5C2022 TaxID=2977129 RepID=UPI0021CE5699|nr:response regulator [Paenibacillus sp. J5C2022]MCU6712939.1 response regulator [Paenibacillus sp. J5C2022]
MLKVAIVDDEMVVRIGIQSLIPWRDHGFEIVGDAEDGEQAVSLIEREKPDIVLTDIVMPGMDGLQLIEYVKNHHPLIHICVLSSYSEYDYVRRALKLGADDYFLKASMKPNELLQLLEEMKSRVSIRHAPAAEATSTTDFGSLLNGSIPAQLEDMMEAQPCRLLVIRAHRHNQSRQAGSEVTQAMLRLLEQQLNEAEGQTVIANKSGEWIAILPENEYGDTADDFIAAAKRFLNVTVSIGCSETVIDRGALAQAYDEAGLAWEYCFHGGTGKVYVLGEYEYALGDSCNDTDAAPRRLLQQLEQSGDKDIRSNVDLVIRCLRERKVQKTQSMELFLEIWHVMKQCLKRRGIDRGFGEHKPFGMPVYERIMHIETMDEAEQLFDTLLQYYDEWVSGWKKATFSSDIRKLLDYIHEHYREPISLKDAADYINLSESYLTHLFKRDTGKSVVEYISELRMNEAAALLRNTDSPSYAIAEAVGYANINYFGRIFKKRMGVSPSQYRDRFRQ